MYVYVFCQPPRLPLGVSESAESSLRLPYYQNPLSGSTSASSGNQHLSIALFCAYFLLSPAQSSYLTAPSACLSLQTRDIISWIFEYQYSVSSAVPSIFVCNLLGIIHSTV